MWMNKIISDQSLAVSFINSDELKPLKIAKMLVATMQKMMTMSTWMDIPLSLCRVDLNIVVRQQIDS